MTMKKQVISDGRVKPKKDIWTVVSIAVLCLFGIFMIYPLAMLLKNAVVNQ